MEDGLVDGFISAERMMMRCLVLFAAVGTACWGTGSTEATADAAEEALGEAHSVEAAITECQRIAEPGRYYLTQGLDGASVELAVEAELAGPYTGDTPLERACIEIAASDVTLDCRDNTLTGPGGNAGDTGGIVIGGSADAPLSQVRIDGCRITGHRIGVYVGHLNGGEISNSQVRRNKGTGVYLIGSSDVSVTANTVEGNDPDGILVLAGRNLTISDNAVFYNRMRGITFDFGSEDCVVSRNESYGHGVLGYAVYASTDIVLEENTAYDNRYHGFAILHEAGSTTFRANESYENRGGGFFLEGSNDNRYADNVSHDNGLDGVVLLANSQRNTFEGNALRDNDGYGAFSDAPIDSATWSDNSFSGNGRGPTGSSDPGSIDWCSYTGFGPQGPCDPVFEGGPNLNDPAGSSTPDGTEASIEAVEIGETVSVPYFGDLWVNTWDDQDRLIFGWGDGTGMADCLMGEELPIGWEDCPYTEDSPGCFRLDSEPMTCEIQQFFCPTYDCDRCYPLCEGTAFGLLALKGDTPDYEACPGESCILARHLPSHSENTPIDPVMWGDDKPSSLLFVQGELIVAGHRPSGAPRVGYLARENEDGIYVELEGSPWTDSSPFKVLMFVQQGQGHRLAPDGWVYALGIPHEFDPEHDQPVHLARVNESEVASYDAYEYFSGLLDDGNPTWSSNPTDAVPVPGLVSNMQGSAMFHPGIERFLFLGGRGNREVPGSPYPERGVLFEAAQPWGPWTQVAQLPVNWPATLVAKGSGPEHVFITRAGEPLGYSLHLIRLDFEMR